LIKIKLLQRKKNGPMKSPENTKNFLMMKDSGNSGMRLSFILDGLNIRYDLKKPFKILKKMNGNSEWRTDG
jgi:hypothetical protein